jgi:hypothetical protein
MPLQGSPVLRSTMESLGPGIGLVVQKAAIGAAAIGI